MLDGGIMLKVVWEFETHWSTYFIYAKDGIADNEKVIKILGCFKHTLVMDWASTDWEHLAKLTFSHPTNENFNWK